MDILSIIRRVNFSDRRDLYITLTAPAFCYAAIRIVTRVISRLSNLDALTPPLRIYCAPSSTACLLDPEDLAYPPDALPGGRDVSTPYGNIRTYEWGPLDGRCALLIHGISTPCIALARLAKALVGQGCRVMLFDLPGRGYSDSPDPAAYPQDATLFSALIMNIMASSAVRDRWFAGFSLVGYSLGGGISAAFTAQYPLLVESLILIAPSGVLRTSRVALSSKLLYGGLLPSWLVKRWVGQRLRPNPPQKRRRSTRKLPSLSSSNKVDVTDAAEEELRSTSRSASRTSNDDPSRGADSWQPIFDDRPAVSPAAAVAWQVSTNPGFLPAFISSIQHAPIHDGLQRWRIIGERCARRRQATALDTTYELGLRESRVLVLLGESDTVIVADETAADAQAALGEENVEVVRLPGGHDVPISNSEGCAQAIGEFWWSS